MSATCACNAGDGSRRLRKCVGLLGMVKDEPAGRPLAPMVIVTLTERADSGTTVSIAAVAERMMKVDEFL